MEDKLEEMRMSVGNPDSQGLHQTAFQLARIDIAKSMAGGMENEIVDLIVRARVYLALLFDIQIERLERLEGGQAKLGDPVNLGSPANVQR